MTYGKLIAGVAAGYEFFERYPGSRELNLEVLGNGDR
jgi:hypothetical protein